MTENQIGLFEDDPRLNALIDRMEDMPDEVLKNQWPQMLAVLVEVIDLALQRENLPAERARALARKVAAAQAAYMGGRSYYIPMGETLFAALRNDEIYTRWYNGEDIEALRRTYRMAQTQIYAVIKEQRQLHTRRIQPDMFTPH
ncbi:MULTISPECIES: Mor transcription activator family protein [Serratia]|uniref:Mor transcription activator family protein n=1 Tax=Serratia TaxID=613 RepID=UPI00065FB208|nr:Mor transcription activator family protein [Serratia sp. 506_PEND]